MEGGGRLNREETVQNRRLLALDRACCSAAMKAADIRAFADRDWRAVEDLKERYWAARGRQLSPAEALRLGDELRQRAQAVRPDWPSEEDRREDLAHHARLAALFRRVHAAADR